MSSIRLIRRAFIIGMLALLLVPSSSVPIAAADDAAAKAAELLRDVHRVVFLGDSITQGGDYVVDVECWLLAHGQQVEVFNLGLSSETATDLTPEENAGHLKQYHFGHPFVSERLDRTLATAKPDLVFACYGMNDGSSLSPDETGTARYAAAITRLRDVTLKAGAKKIVLCSPPIRDNRASPSAMSLERYAAWLLTKRVDGWDVVDIQTPMRQAQEAARVKNPAFTFTKDDVHPGREGHWVMAQAILSQYFGAKLDNVATAEELFPVHGADIRKLVYQRMRVRFEAYMTQIGHKRPGVAGGPGAKPGLSIAEADVKAAEITAHIAKLLADKKP